MLFRRVSRFLAFLCYAVLLGLVPTASAALTFTLGHYYSANQGSLRISEYNAAGTVVGTFDLPSALGQEARGVVFGPDGFLYVTVVRGSGFSVLALDSTCTVQAIYSVANVYTAGALSYGRLAVDAQHIFVTAGNQVTRFDIGAPNSGVAIYNDNQLYDVKLLPSGNLFIATAYHIFEITASGTVVREIVLKAADPNDPKAYLVFFTDIRGLEYNPTTNKLFVTHLGHTDFFSQFMRIDASTGVLEKNITFGGDDLFLTTSGNLLVGSSFQVPRVFTQDLDQVGTLGTTAQPFVTQLTTPPQPPPQAPTPPTGGSYTVAPTSSVNSTTTLTATFAGWQGYTAPLTYSVREGSTLITPPGANTAPTFTLSTGTHQVYGRIIDGHGIETNTAPVTIVVQAPPPPAGGSFTVAPTGPVLPTTTFTANFTGWQGSTPSLNYAVRVGNTVIVPAGSNPSPTFTLPAGTQQVYGRITDTAGRFTDTPTTAIVVDGTAPVITPPVSGFTPLQVLESTNWPNYAGQATITDNVGVNNITQDPPAGTVVPFPFSGQVTITATDRAGNSTSYPLSVQVIRFSPAFVALCSTGGAVANPSGDVRIQAGAQWVAFGMPAINAAGHVAFLGRWKAPAVIGPVPRRAQAGTGIFVDDTLIVKVGDPVPGIEGATFKTFKDPVLDDRDHVAFLASIAGSDNGHDSVVVTTGRDGQLEVLAREGFSAPDTGGALFKSFTSVSIQSPVSDIAPRGVAPTPTGSASGIVFTAMLARGSGLPVINTTNDLGTWWLPSGGTSVEALVREGDELFGPGETVKSFTLLNALAASPAHGRGQTSGDGVLFQATSSAGRQGAFSVHPGATQNLAITGGLLNSTGIFGIRWQKLNLPSSDARQQNIAVYGILSPRDGGMTAAYARGIYVSRDSGASWEPLARTFDSAPALGDTAVFSSFRDPVQATTGLGVAFLASATGGTVTSPTNNEALWWQPPGGALTLVARESDQPPGAPIGAKWKAFTSLAYPGSLDGTPGPIFTATLQHGPGGITGIDDLALYAVDSAHTLRELVRENQSLLGKPVQGFSVLKALTGSAGTGRAGNSHGAVVLLATFADKTTAIVRIDLP